MPPTSSNYIDQILDILHNYAKADGMDDNKITLDGAGKTRRVVETMKKTEFGTNNTLLRAHITAARDTTDQKPALLGNEKRLERRREFVMALNHFISPDFWMKPPEDLKCELTLAPDDNIKAAFEKAMKAGLKPETIKQALAECITKTVPPPPSLPRSAKAHENTR